MAPNLTAGEFKIISLIEGNPPVGVGFIQPTFQIVHLNGSARTWVVRKEGEHTYRLSVGGYPYTGIDDKKKVTATVHENQNVEWRATYRKLQDAYTIEPIHDTNRGWTVPHGSKADSHAEIEIDIIIVLPVEPVKYPISQLFRFAPVLE